jgi:predicted ATPase
MRFIKKSDPKVLAATLRSVSILTPVDDGDANGFRNQYRLHYIDDSGGLHHIGRLKIGCGVASVLSDGVVDYREPPVDDVFDFLPERYFSLGQSERYYDELMALDAKIARQILKDLNDCADNLDLFDRVKSEPSMVVSLLSKVSEKNVRNRYHRLCQGDPKLTPFEFRYTLPPTGGHFGAPPPSIEFNVEPQSLPPTNVHVLIGRNGVGKTVCMQQIAATLLNIDDDGRNTTGTIELLGENQDEWAFAGLVWVSFSAFDDFDLPASSRRNMNATSIGLRYQKEASGENLIRSTRQLGENFCRSFSACRRGARRKRWARAIQTLSSDIMFNDADALALLKFNDDMWVEKALSFFEHLSSGHKVVLLTMTRLVETVDEKTIVLIDEPEVHLHPPLLAAFIRALAELLLSRNGISIIATHSPVVLQEVPASCVSVIERSGPYVSVKRPRVETFGENIGLLTSEVFRLDVTDAGFHQLLLRNVAGNVNSFEEIAEKFANQLGGEGRAILKGMVVNRDRSAS